MHPLVNIATRAAEEAGRFLLRHADRVDQLVVERKGRSDFVTQVDRGAERLVVDTIRRFYPDHAILGEEGGASGNVLSDVQWIVDPLDGTTNFLHRVPEFCVSIGVKVRGRLEHGVIYAPLAREMYTASHGEGAFLNNRRIRVSRTTEMDTALIGTGFPIRNADTLDRYLPMLRRVAEGTAGLRRMGSAALDLAHVASGRFDGFFELALKPWDIAAGVVLVREAGGMVVELDGYDDVLDTGNVVAGNVRTIELLMALLRDGSGSGAGSSTGLGTAASAGNRATV